MNLRKYRNLFTCLFIAMALSSCSTTNWPTVDQVIENIADVMPDILGMVTAASYIGGLLLIMRGVYKLKEYGELRTMMSSQTSIMQPVVILCIGGGLLYFPSSYEVGLMTLFDYSSPLTYSSSGDTTSDMTSAIVIIMQVIGAIAFIRGMLMMQNVAGQGAQPGTFTKALTHIVGGLLSINIYGTWEVLSNTLLGV